MMALADQQASQLILRGESDCGRSDVGFVAAAWLEALGAHSVHIRISNSHKTAPAGQVRALMRIYGCLLSLQARHEPTSLAG